ncbi:MAG: hypothetical protein IPI62_14570 [Bacteroidetes bacterium]|nr:hypothetical protein [Bacteroidota bacterium]
MNIRRFLLADKNFRGIMFLLWRLPQASLILFSALGQAYGDGMRFLQFYFD